MKKACILLLAVAIITLSAVEFIGNNFSVHTEYLRIHIRANSNDDADQEVKYAVKDEIVSFLTPLLADCDTKEKAESVLKENLKNVESVADAVLIKNRKDYRSSAKIKNEEFPTRKYENLTLESGYYDALIVNLGSGEGDNWWCVVYPPLCFVGTGKYEYRSKIKEIIDRFFYKGER